MRGEIDLRISIDVVIRAAAQTVATGKKISSIRHGCIEYGGIESTKTEVICAEATIGRTARPEWRTDGLIQCGEDEERVSDRGLPALDAHRMRDFVSDIGILEEGSGRIGRCIHECTCESSVCRSLTTRVCVLLVVFVKPGVPNVSEVAL
jgi:hypothetical protein